MNTNLLEKLREEMIIKLNASLYYQTQLSFAFNSNKIEGNELTELEIKNIFETNTINCYSVLINKYINIDDILKIKNHFICFDYMLEYASEDLSEEMINEFCRILQSGTLGELKYQPNVNFQARANSNKEGRQLSANKVERLLQEYKQKKSPTFEDIIELHCKFISISPFQKCNGLIGRMIMFKECLANNITPLIIEHTHKDFYSKGLKLYDTQKCYLIDICRLAQVGYEKNVVYFSSSMRGVVNFQTEKKLQLKSKEYSTLIIEKKGNSSVIKSKVFLDGVYIGKFQTSFGFLMRVSKGRHSIYCSSFGLTSNILIFESDNKKNIIELVLTNRLKSTLKEVSTDNPYKKINDLKTYMNSKKNKNTEKNYSLQELDTYDLLDGD